MNQIYTNGHSIMVKGNKLIIDGKLVDVKLKRSPFGGSSIVSNVVLSNATSKIKIGENTIVLKGKKITVNGKEVSLNGEKPVDDKTIEEELNYNAKKYLISTAKEDEIEVDGEVCHRIIAMENIVDKKGTILVKKGVKGGYIQSRDNLAEEGLCWIYGDAVVCEGAKVKGDAKVSDSAVICGTATIDDYALVSQEAILSGKSHVSGKAQIYGKANISGDCSVSDNAQISGNANISGMCSVSGNAQISGNADISGMCSVSGNAQISENADISGMCSIGGNVKIGGNVDLSGSIDLSGDEVITKNRQVEDLFEKNDISNVSIKGFNNRGIILGDVRVNGEQDVQEKKSKENLTEHQSQGEIMLNKEIKKWIEEGVRKNPKLSEEYKKQRLLCLQTKLKENEKRFNREGYASYRSPYESKRIIELRDEIQEVKSTSAEELLLDRMIMEYSALYSTEKQIKLLKSLTDEDHYIEGVFSETKYNIRCQDDLKDRQISKNNEDLKTINSIYQKGLAKRNYFVKEGQKSHNKLLAEAEAELDEYVDIGKKIQDVIENEIVENKFYCRSLAKMSVVDAFDQMGAQLEEKHAEKIMEIIKLHDPNVVQTAIQRLSETPTKNMRALVRNIQNAPAQSRKELKVMKAVDIASLATGGILTALGIVGASLGNPAMLTTAMLGMGNLGLGGSGMLRHTKKTNNLDEKDVLMSGCIDDLLNEVVLEETFNQGLGK